MLISVSAQIDIIVSSPDSTDPRLIVETKLALRDGGAAETQLKQSMLQLSCPVGLIVTPERMWIFSDRRTSGTPESIQKIGDFAIGHLLQFRPANKTPRESVRFEEAVQYWLENLPRIASPEIVKDSALWHALNTLVIPVIETGEVRAAAPRHRYYL
jgi:hypothetical protein